MLVWFKKGENVTLNFITPYAFMMRPDRITELRCECAYFSTNMSVPVFYIPVRGSGINKAEAALRQR